MKQHKHKEHAIDTCTAFTNGNPETNQIILHEFKIAVDHVCGMQISVFFKQLR
jgi:hypothetical protein